MTFLQDLAKNKIITEDDVREIENESNQSGKTVEDILKERGLHDSQILTSKGYYFNVPTRHVEDNIPSEILEYIPQNSVEHYKIAPLGVREGVLEVGMVDPDNVEAKDALQFISSKLNIPYKIFLISEADLENVIKSYKGLSGEINEAVLEFEADLSQEDKKTPKKSTLSSAEEEKEKRSEATTIIEDAPVTKIVSNIIKYAVEGLASDVHIEHTGENVRVRFRVDGILHTSLVLPSKVHGALISRIKILSGMRLDEKRKPQDNRFSAEIGNRKIDFRVSTFPSYFGEKIVMRILDSEKGAVKLEETGLSPRNIELIRAAIRKPYGLILISGPTGSGKTTTLYSMISELDRETKNVISLEDPVEYNIGSISQSQVRPEIGYTFASGLRTILRQDPDIIMVGEIRDKETAQLAIQAALTGHLVFSTIHTNSAVGVIPRLVDMGVDPYLIAPTLIMAMGQRLASKLCEGSGKPIPVTDSVRIMIEREFQDLPDEHRAQIKIPDTLYEPSPTKDCPHGTRGRIAVSEVFRMTREIEKVILEDPTEPNVLRAARLDGMLTMKQDALIKAFEKKIPFEEVNKL